MFIDIYLLFLVCIKNDVLLVCLECGTPGIPNCKIQKLIEHYAQFVRNIGTMPFPRRKQRLFFLRERKDVDDRNGEKRRKIG